MAAAYDTYDYPSYWEGREYEHFSEVLAIRSLLDRIPKISTILEIGAGFGRLTSIYKFRAKKIILTDPSAKLLKLARETNQDKKIKVIQASVENLKDRVKSRSDDLIICVRVLHHIKDLDSAIETATKILKKKGYFILEFANKRHAKAAVSEILKGNITYPLDISPKDIRSRKSKKAKTLPFINYHPDLVFEKLEKHGFKILEKRSVSNVRSSFIKRLVPTEVLLFIENLLQKPLSVISFGPSIFVLAQKKG